MPLTPADVHNVVFSRPRLGKRGYSEQEVDLFLELVEDELLRHIEESNTIGNGADFAQDPELQNRDAELRRWDGQLRQWDAELRQWDVELTDQEAELGQRETELRGYEATLHQKAAELRQHEAALHQKAAELHKHEVARHQKVAAMREQDAKLRRDEATLQKRAADLHKQEARINTHDTFPQENGHIAHNGNGNGLANGHVNGNGNGLANGHVNGNGNGLANGHVDQQQTAVSEDQQVTTWRTVSEVHGRHAMELTAVRAVADLIGSSTTETAHERMRKTEADQNGRSVVAIEASQVKQLQQENAELSRANEILKAAAALFASEIQKPALALEDAPRLT